jgi:hypothetical protein
MTYFKLKIAQYHFAKAHKNYRRKEKSEKMSLASFGQIATLGFKEYSIDINDSIIVEESISRRNSLAASKKIRKNPREA